MTITTLSSRELNQDVAKAKNAAQDGPVFITDRGRTTHVLLSFEEYQRLTQQRSNIADALAMPGVEDIEFALRAWRSVSSRLIFDDVRSRYQRRFRAPEGANRQGGQSLQAGSSTVDAPTLSSRQSRSWSWRPASCKSNAGTRPKVRFCGRGSMGMSCRSSRVACCRSILRSRNDAHDSMYRIGGRSGTHSLPQRRSCMA